MSTSSERIQQFARMTRQQAQSFMEHAPPQRARERLAELVAGRDVLDIGCGKGEQVQDLYHPERYVGIDCSVELIRIAQLRNPGYTFVCQDARDISGFHPVAVMKAVLEHLTPNEAVAVYEHVRAHTGLLYLCWHTEPRAGMPESVVYDGELGPMIQVRHDRRDFPGVAATETVGPHVIWTVV